MRFLRIKELADCSAIILRPLASEEHDDWVVAHDAPNGVETRRSPHFTYAQATRRYESEVGLWVPDAAGLRTRALALVAEERGRQEVKWGPQAHDDVDRNLTDRMGGCTAERMAEEYEIPFAARAKFICETEAARGGGTWASVAVEELSEVVEAATLAQQGKGATESLERELVQLAAVAVAWLEGKMRRRLEEAAEVARFHDAVADVARVFGEPTLTKRDEREAWWAAGSGAFAGDGMLFSAKPEAPSFALRRGVASNTVPLHGVPLGRAAREARDWFLQWGVVFPVDGADR